LIQRGVTMKPRRHAKLSQHDAKATMQSQTAEALEAFWKWVEETPAPTLTQIEDAVLEFRQRIGQAMAQAAIQVQPAVQPAPGPRCPRCGREMQLKGTKDRTITARVGDVDLERSHYHCPHCQEGLFPLDEQLQVHEGSCSAEVAKLSVWLCGQVTTENAETILEKLGGIVFSDSSIWRRVQTWGAKLQAQDTFERAAANALPPQGSVTPPAKTLPKEMGVGMDGVLISLRKEGFKELKVGNVFEITHCRETDAESGEVIENAHAIHPSYTAVLGGPEAFGQAVWAEACRREFPHARDNLVIGDGAVWIWNLTQEHFGSSRQVVDWYHATEHLHHAAHLIWGEGSAEALRWAKKMETPLYQGQAWQVAERIRDLATAHPHAAKALQAEAGYFENNRRRMQYLELREDGFPIGSGMVESGCKQYRARFNGAGMRWSRPGAEHLIPIRTAILSGRFDERWACVSKSPPD
jgi:hypothetical protein